MGSCISVYSYQAPVSKKYNTNMQVQKNYNIHNNNPVHPSAKLTQTMCVNTDIFQPHWKYFLEKQVMTVASIIR